MATPSSVHLAQDADRDSTPPLREGWLLRADKIVSKVFLHRYARLYEDRLEVFHVKEGGKDSPELEAAVQLAGSKLDAVQQMEVDVKPRGSNLFLGYVSGDIKSKTMVRASL